MLLEGGEIFIELHFSSKELCVTLQMHLSQGITSRKRSRCLNITHGLICHHQFLQADQA